MSDETAAGVEAANGLLGANLSFFRGKRDWLFLREGPAVDTVGLYTGKRPLSQQDWDNWRAIFEGRTQWCAEHDAVCAVFNSPDAHVVYSDYLPEDMVVSYRPIDLLQRRMHDLPSLAIVDPTDALVAARRDAEPYMRTDTHWNQFGAFEAYRCYMAALPSQYRIRVLTPDSIRWGNRRVIGDLGVLCDPEESCEVPIATILDSDSNLVNEVRGVTRNFVYQEFLNARSDLPTALVFRDSYGSALLPFLKESFSRLVAVSCGTMLYDLAEIVRPDCVIFQRAERGLVNVPKDRAGYKTIFGHNLARVL